MSNVFLYLKKYKYKMLIFLLYILLFLQMQNVYMYADDYSVLLYDRFDFNHFNVLMSWFYKEWSGRLIGHFLVIAILNWFGLSFFRIFNTIILFFISYFLEKIINIKKRFNSDKLLLIISIIFFGLDIIINCEVLYWTYGAVLYLWGLLPLFIVVYFIFDSIINNRKFTKFRLVSSFICITIISFILESTAVFFIVFSLLVLLSKCVDKENRKSILYLFLYSVFLIILVFFIPGNINRLLGQDYNVNIFSQFIIKLRYYCSTLYNTSCIIKSIIILSSILTINLFKNNSFKFNRVLSFILCLLNILILFSLNINISFDLFNNNLFLGLFVSYLLINLYILIVSYSNREKKLYVLFLISGICSSLVSIILIDYNICRFYFLMIVSFMVIILYIFLNENVKNQLLILFLFCFFINIYLFLFLIFLYVLFYIKKYDFSVLKFLLILVFIFYNLFYFSLTHYYYYQNSKVFDYNDYVLSNYKIYRRALKSDLDFSAVDFSVIDRKTSIIYLKKIKYPLYAYHTADNYDYIIDWYKTYYNIEVYKIVWADE